MREKVNKIKDVFVETIQSRQTCKDNQEIPWGARGLVVKGVGIICGKTWDVLRTQ